MLNIVADENIPRVAEFFQALGTVKTLPGRVMSPGDLAAADVLLVRSVTPVNASLLAGTPVRFVGTATSGVDHVDRDYLADAGIQFAAAPGANANSVVEYVLAAIAAVEDILERLLAGGTVGIVGYGHVGRLLARRLDALGIARVVSDPWLDASTLPEQASLDEILACDVVSVHAELTDEQPWPSRHLFGLEEIQRMDGGSLLLNASRGPVVDNAALLQLLERGDAPLVALDVWEDEPDIDPRLLDKVAIGTAHIAGYSLDGKLRGTQMLLRYCAAALGLDAPPLEPGQQEAPELTLAAGLDTPASLRSLLLQRYDIMGDDASLRAAVRAAGGHPHGEAFDRLRRDYPERRELAGATVVADQISHEQAELVAALGCRLDATP